MDTWCGGCNSDLTLPNCGSECDLTDPRNASLYPDFYYNEDLKQTQSQRAPPWTSLDASIVIYSGNCYCSHWWLVTSYSRLPDQKLILSRTSDYFARDLSSTITLFTVRDVQNVASWLSCKAVSPSPSPSPRRVYRPDQWHRLLLMAQTTRELWQLVLTSAGLRLLKLGTVRLISRVLISCLQSLGMTRKCHCRYGNSNHSGRYYEKIKENWLLIASVENTTKRNRLLFRSTDNNTLSSR